jgi:hypothetical protein
MKKLFSIFAALLFAGSMMATDVTFVAGTDKADGTSITKDNVTISVTAGTFSRTDNYRCYASNTMTISCSVGVITNIAFTFSGTNTGGWETSYQPNATSWTSPTTSAQARMTQVVVSYTVASVAEPTFTPTNGDFVGSVNVTLACATSEAVVYYTTDENFKTSPSTTDWIPYSTAIPLSATTTIWAAALKGDEWSNVAEKTYTKHELINCAAAAALAKDEVAFLGEVTVTYVNGANIYVKDASGYALLYAFDYGLVPGDVVNGFVGISAPYSGLPELKPSGITKDDLTVVHGTAPDPEVLTAAPTNADINKYFVIKNVTLEGEFTTSAKTNLTATIGEQTFTLRNNFQIAQTFEAGKKYDIVGVGSIYNTTLQTYFISATEAVETVNYYLKNNWGGGDWTWQQTTKVSDNEYKLENVVFGGTGVNVNTAASDEGSSWIAHESFNGNTIKALDTVTLTYVVSSNSISAILLGSYVAPADPTWTVAGSSAAAFGTTWAADNADNDMVKQSDGTFLWERTGLVLAAGSVNFKVCRDHAWTVAYPASDYSLAISADGIYTITITFDPSTNTVSATATKTGDAVVTPVIELKGSWNAAGAYDATWNGGAAYTFVESGVVATYTVNFTETGTYELGLQVNGAWTANGATITRTAPGTDLDNGGTGNMHLVVDVVGEYEFIWTYAVNNLTVMFPDAPVAGCDWDNIDFLGDGSPEQTFGSQFKVCKPDNVGVVNIQKPGFADETGIYMTFPSAAFGTFSLAANQYAIQGAGVVFYLSAFSLRETEVTVNCEGNDIVFTVFNAKGIATGIENNAVVEKAVKFIENGQLYIIKNGVKYNAQGAVVR